MTPEDWDKLAPLGVLRAVIDPADASGLKNGLIDAVQWRALRAALPGRGRVLDVGCGTGRFAQRLAAQGLDYTGADTSPQMIAEATGAMAGERMRFIHYPGPDLPFADASFDCVVTVGVVQYVMGGEMQAPLYAELRRVLAPGGRLILIEQASLAGIASSSVDKAATPDDYREALEGAGFKVDGVRTLRTNDFSRPASALIKLAQKGLRDPLLSAASAAELFMSGLKSPERLSRARYFDIRILASPTT